MGIFTTKEKVIVEDISSNLRMSNHGFLRILQEAANMASTQAGHGLTDIDKTNTTWVLLNWRVKILKRPEYNDIVTINTWASFSKNIYSIRGFELYVNDELIAIADSKWVYVNAHTHQIEKIDDDLIANYGQEEKTLFDTEFRDRTKMQDGLEELYTYTTMKRDLDVNHHVNNIIFLDIANEILVNDITTNSTEFSVVYKKEIAYKDTISCYKTIEENNSTVVFLYNKEKDILHGVIKIK